MITNETQFAAALADANQRKLRTTLELSGEISITKPHYLKANISLRGPARLNYFAGGLLTWQGIVSGTYPLNAKPFAEVIQSNAPVTPGSYIICQSEDVLPVEPHTLNGKQFPQELHLVNYAKAGSIGVECFVVDAMTNGSLSVLNPIDNISISDLELVFKDTTQPTYNTAIKFDGVVNSEIENVRLLRNGPGAIWLNNSYNCSIQCRIDGTAASDNVYGIVVGTVNNITIKDSLITGCRHAFTTTAGRSMGMNRWGTPLNVVMRDSTINVPTKLEIGPNATRVGFDTHAEGYGITLQNSVVNVGTGASNYGIFIRSRAPKILGCTINGGLGTKAIEFYGSDGIVDHCIIDRAWIGVAAKKIQQPFVNHISVSNTMFRNLQGPACHFEAGGNHVVHNLGFDRVMLNPGSKFAGHTTPIIGQHTVI